ncbi:hypothetical protein AAC387_Pa05g1748 [Persea americana]
MPMKNSSSSTSFKGEDEQVGLFSCWVRFKLRFLWRKRERQPKPGLLLLQQNHVSIDEKRFWEFGYWW